MIETRLHIKDIVIDCQDAERLASFWAALLGRAIAARIGPYIWLERDSGPGLGFQQITSPRTGKNRVHFDLASANPAAEQSRVELLGGRRLEEYAAGGFLVMADPEGNEFCIIPKDPFDVDDEGRANYLADDSPSEEASGVSHTD